VVSLCHCVSLFPEKNTYAVPCSIKAQTEEGGGVENEGCGGSRGRNSQGGRTGPPLSLPDKG